MNSFEIGARLIVLFLVFSSMFLAAFTSPAALVHQWKFNESTGTNLFDSVGTAPAWVVITNGGGSYQLNGRRLRLDGGARSNSDYVAFPKTVFDGLTNATIEIWAIPHSFPTGAHVFDLGPGDNGDLNLNLVYAVFAQGTNGDLQRYGLNGLTSVDTTQLTPVDREYHYVMTWSASGQLGFYRDGILLGTQDTSPRNLATIAALTNTTFWLGRSHFLTNATANASYNEVRIYDTVLDAATIAADFHRGAEDTAGLLHRWSFSETSGTNFADSVGTSTSSVVVLGTADYTLGGGQVTLAGGARTAADYVSFAARRFDGLANMSIEIWATPSSAQNWGRVFDIGDGITTGTSFFLSFTQGGDINSQRLEFVPSGTADSTLATTLGNAYHYVVTWDAAAGTCSWYRNGVRVNSLLLGTQSLANVPDTVFWLGRSHYPNDNTANAAYDEVRVYNRALQSNEIAFHFQQGPGSIAAPPALTTNDSITIAPGGAVLLDVLANDMPARFDPNSLMVLTLPAFGSAVLKASGRIFYTNANLAATSDTFTYRVADNVTGLYATGTVFVTISGAFRLPATTLKMPSSPPALTYQVVDAFPGLTFTNPLAIRTPPGVTNQVFIVERRGIISYVPDINAANPVRQVFLDISSRVAFDNTPEGELGLLSMEFHPGFATNGIFFVFYTAPNGAIYFDRLSRFNSTNLVANPNSEQILISVVDEAFNHNGGDLHFGNEGYLYICTGDEGNQYNYFQNAQRIDKDFYSGLLRIDVDKRPGNLEPTPHSAVPTDALGKAFYSIPADNPFVGATTFLGSPINTNALRAEFFAVGTRHIWRFSIDPTNNEIWAGDVGQDTYEEVDLMKKGLNYGWAYYEALTPTIQLYPNQTTLLTNPPPSFTNTAPVWFYPHTASTGGDPQYKGNSITGGLVYHGSRIPALAGAYIFADFESANLWALRRTNSTVDVQRIAGQVGIAAFGTDPGNGDVLIANYLFNKIQRIVSADAASSAFPQKLSDTGAFADVTTLTPNPGLVNYEPILSFWSDYGVKRRWFALPDLGSQITPALDLNWTLPNGMVWVKHFDLELTRGNPATKKRIETRFLVKTLAGVYGVSYQWNAAGNEAFLVPDGGTNFNLNVTVGAATVTQQWEIPSRSACLICHVPVAGYALSFNLRQLNQTATLNGVTGNQLTTLSQAGYFTAPVSNVNVLPAYATATNTAASLEYRVRSYLAVNCIQCHQAGASGPGTWDARPALTLDQTGLINGAPNNNGANPANKLVVPGDLTHSILLNRLLGTNGFTRMPPLATHQLDQGAIDLMTQWIATELTNRQSFADWQIAFFGATNAPNAAANADPDGDGANNYYEFLTKTSPIVSNAPWQIAINQTANNIGVIFLQLANRGFQVETSPNLSTWTPWNVPGNQVFFGAANQMTTVAGPQLTNEILRFYRVKIYEP